MTSREPDTIHFAEPCEPADGVEPAEPAEPREDGEPVVVNLGRTPVAGKLCPLTAFSQAAGGKYKMRILWDLAQGPRRYGELRRSAVVAALGKEVTARVLSRELKELECRGLIHREQFPVVPPKVEYSLTDLGRSLIPVIDRIVTWGLLNGR